MTEDWKDLLGKLRNQMGSRGANRDKPDLPKDAPKSDQPIRLNLGIDFGTSYTKVCFFDASEQMSGFVELGQDDGIIPSDVRSDKNGRLFMAHHVPDGMKTNIHRYLKMQLANLEEGSDDLNECKALSAWFLANVLKECQEKLMEQEKDRFIGRYGLWSANIGVPVEWYDDEILSRFQEVLQVAWFWHKNNNIPTHVDQVIKAYSEALGEAEELASDFHAIPEIAAAVQSFVISREAAPGLYVYFDIGGGTVDGVVFKLEVKDGLKHIDFYSGKVDDLGMAFQKNTPDFWKKVKRLVGAVVVGGKDKDRSDWRRRRNEGRPNVLSIHLIPEKDILPLVVFLGGYGARSKKYKSVIESTYDDFNLRNASIPRFELREVKKPNDLIDRGAHEFRRYAIAYGLSIPFGQGPEVRLPSQIANDPGPRRRRLANIPDYLDSKDWC